jgi:hypothetical protein
VPEDPRIIELNIQTLSGIAEARPPHSGTWQRLIDLLAEAQAQLPAAAMSSQNR